MVTIVYSKQYVGGVMDGVVSSGNRIVLSVAQFASWRSLLESVQVDAQGFRYEVIAYDVSGY